MAKTGIIKLVGARRAALLDRIVLLTLSVMLFFMGIRIGIIENIGQKLVEIGLISVSFAFATVIGTSVVVLFTLFLLRKVIHKPEPHKEKIHIMHHLKEPVYLLFLMISGIVSGLFIPVLKSVNGNITTWLLYLLLFLIGIQLGTSKTKNTVFQASMVLLPLSTAIGSLFGGLAIGGFFSLSPGESLSLAAGFGWYTLSGVIITDMGNPVLGSAGFMINLFRETIALIAIPLLGRTRFSLVSIGIAGATSMDVTLPLIERSCGKEFVSLALGHGILLSLLVPLLVPLFYNL
ncbi:MAG: lysine exporter LysO family protein [Spirochaetia bacterium]|nr:lysine exporter LysO family protein [Spirochaetia bacterium]